MYEPISKQCGLPFKIDCIGSGRTKLQVRILFGSEPVSCHPYLLQTCDVSTYSCLKYGGIKYCLNAIFYDI